MFKGLLVTLGALVSLQASANFNVETVMVNATQAIFSEPLAGPNWKVGDTASYKLNVGGFINGTMVMTITNLTNSELTINQAMDLMGQKQACDMTIDTTNGKIKKVICNGQDQTPNENENAIEVVDMKEDKITVPAGSFECIHIIAKQVKDGKEINQWVNPKLIPVSGMIKMIAPSPLGKMTAELTSYKKM